MFWLLGVAPKMTRCEFKFNKFSSPWEGPLLSASHGGAQAVDVLAQVLFKKVIFFHISYFRFDLNVWAALCCSKYDEV